MKKKEEISTATKLQNYNPQKLNRHKKEIITGKQPLQQTRETQGKT